MGAEEGIEWGGRPSTARHFDLSNRELIQVQRTARIFEIATEQRYAERGINLVHPFPVIITRSDSWDPVRHRSRPSRTKDSQRPGLTAQANQEPSGNAGLTCCTCWQPEIAGASCQRHCSATACPVRLCGIGDWDKPPNWPNL